MTSSGRPPMPSACSSLTASGWKAAVAISPAGVPPLASSPASGGLPDLPDPPAPGPPRARAPPPPHRAQHANAARHGAFILRPSPAEPQGETLLDSSLGAG